MVASCVFDMKREFMCEGTVYTHQETRKYEVNIHDVADLACEIAARFVCLWCESYVPKE